MVRFACLYERPRLPLLRTGVALGLEDDLLDEEEDLVEVVLLELVRMANGLVEDLVELVKVLAILEEERVLFFVDVVMAVDEDLLGTDKRSDVLVLLRRGIVTDVFSELEVVLRVVGMG
jgi:hypothetical protein